MKILIRLEHDSDNYESEVAGDLGMNPVRVRADLNGLVMDGYISESGGYLDLPKEYQLEQKGLAILRENSLAAD